MLIASRCLIFILVIDSPCVPVSVFGFVDGQTANETNRVTIRQPEPQSIADLLGALTEIRSDNQEQFERCVCHFRLTQWIAGTLDDAMSDPSKPLRGEAVCGASHEAEHPRRKCGVPVAEIGQDEAALRELLDARRAGDEVVEGHRGDEDIAGGGDATLDGVLHSVRPAHRV